jgi:uncharacterized cupin superfamily protein
MKSPIINIASIELKPMPTVMEPTGAAAERFGARMGFISNLIGGKQLGYNITAIPKGKRAFPFHNHQVNEEMFFVLAGHGEIRIGDGAFPIKEGDIIACPAGGKETAHQIINTSEEELRFLAVSTKLSPEIAEYPDTNRFGVLASLAPDETGRPRTMSMSARRGTVYITGKVNRWTVIFCSCSNLYEASFSQVFSKFAGAWRVDG